MYYTNYLCGPTAFPPGRGCQTRRLRKAKQRVLGKKMVQRQRTDERLVDGPEKNSSGQETTVEGTKYDCQS